MSYMTNLALWLGLSVLVVAGLALWYFSGTPVAAPAPSATTPSVLAPPSDQGAFGRETTAPAGPSATTTPPPTAPVDTSTGKG